MKTRRLAVKNRKILPYPTRKENGRWEAFVHGAWYSKQRAWQIYHHSLGLCELCKAPRHPDSLNFCKTHHLVMRYRSRKSYMHRKMRVGRLKPDHVIGREYEPRP